MYSRNSLWHILFLCFSLLLLTTACHNSQKKENQHKGTTSFTVYQPGVVVNRVPCATDTSQSYALYLPSNYIQGKPFPVVFFFDAHARGALVVQKYKSVAEQLGFILVASNNSENGQDEELRNKILYHFMLDVEKRFTLDPKRIYTAGFSGGARVASGIGLFNKSVAGTIGFEAGFPAVRQLPDHHLTWVGVVGNTDFNYLEMKNLEAQLNSLGMRNLLLVHPGIHELPPPEMFKKAYEFLMLDAIRKQISPVNQPLIDSVKSGYDKIRIKAQKDHQCLQQLQADQALVKNLEGLTDLSFYQKEIQILSVREDCQSTLKREEILNKTESEFQQQFAESMNSKDAGWWKQEINMIYKKKKAARYEDEKLMNQRLLNYLSLMSYMYANGSLKNKQPDQTKKFLMMYQMVDPENSEVYFIKAEYYGLIRKDADALQSLQDALDHGFHDAFRIKNNFYFHALKSSEQFGHILNEIKK